MSDIDLSDMDVDQVEALINYFQDLCEVITVYREEEEVKEILLNSIRDLLCFSWKIKCVENNAKIYSKFYFGTNLVLGFFKRIIEFLYYLEHEYSKAPEHIGFIYLNSLISSFVERCKEILHGLKKKELDLWLISLVEPLSLNK